MRPIYILLIVAATTLPLADALFASAKTARDPSATHPGLAAAASSSEVINITNGFGPGLGPNGFGPGLGSNGFGPGLGPNG